MYTFTILLCFVPLLANCDKALHDGPCPKPPPAEDISKFGDVLHTWKTNLDNNEELEKNPIACATCTLRARDDGGKGYYQDYIYKQSNKQYHLVQTYEPNKNFTEWITTELNKKTGKFEPDGWVNTIVKIEGEGKDTGIMEYSCKNEGKQHRSMYRIYGREYPPNAEVQKKLEELYEKVGDGRKMFKVNWDNCD